MTGNGKRLDTERGWKRGFLPLLASFCLAVPAVAAQKKSADPDTIQLVRAFLKLQASDLPPEAVPHFLEVDVDTLPQKMRKPFLAKKLELYALKQLADGKRHGFIRQVALSCQIPQDAKSIQADLIKLAGFSEISSGDFSELMQKTGCTQHDMLCEFSLQVVPVKDAHGKVAKQRYFLYPTDPLFTFLSRQRQQAQQPNGEGEGGGAAGHFFVITFQPRCVHAGDNGGGGGFRPVDDD